MEWYEIIMPDSSVYVIENEFWRKAFLMKYGDNTELAIDQFKESVKKHWDNKTIPTKFGWDEKWEEQLEGDFAYGKQNYKDMAELAPDVLYIVIRAPLMSIAMAEMSKDKAPPKVIAIDKDGATVYDGEKKKEFKNIDKALEDEK